MRLMLFSLLTGYTEKEFINIYNEGVRNDQESLCTYINNQF